MSRAEANDDRQPNETELVETEPITIVPPPITTPSVARAPVAIPDSTPVAVSPVSPAPSAPTVRLLAVHIGRSGEVAGGMSQVINGYLAHSFADFDLRMISSRDGSGGVRAALLAASAFWKVLRLADPERTVVVAHLSQGGSFAREGALVALAHARGFATVAQLHGSSFADFAAKRPGLVGRVLRAADVVLTLSSESRTAAAEFVPGERVVLVPNAVADGVHREIEPLVVFGGAVSKRKGVDVLAAAWQRLAPEHPLWRLVIAGPIRDQPAVPLTRGEFVGALSHEALMKLLERSSIAVLPSRDEAMPMFILEAMARNNCVVATRVGGVPAVLANGVGVIVDPGDADSLETALRQAIADDAWRAKKADLARSAFESTYSAAAVFPLVERSWRAALDRRSDGVAMKYRPGSRSPSLQP
ncbi:glycosyltransferase [Cryobacterium sp. PH31-O1]|uniref:glycosyltransferase n=1 Tax=Cryobacterium sp. PH31-O1 TaxID=3046306 RepID=UPI0024B8DB13|nr:glycosyltransferase [Cryobacterium sp. PH31-O1]MDJ0338186.1 glycosyltransferase [Cryobacterium sp. PH31-O1]